ncbi:MAG: XRE family transcriptional regulator [Cyanobacteria bacterium J06627_28]
MREQKAILQRCYTTSETQPRISNLMNGEISRFSVDKLINLLGKIGMEIRIEVLPHAV